MITYEECLSDKHLNLLKRLVYQGRFSSVAKTLEYAILDIITEHVLFGHIALSEPHTAETLIKKQFYPNRREFVRSAVRELLIREKLWGKN